MSHTVLVIVDPLCTSDSKSIETKRTGESDYAKIVEGVLWGAAR